MVTAASDRPRPAPGCQALDGEPGQGPSPWGSLPPVMSCVTARKRAHLLSRLPLRRALVAGGLTFPHVSALINVLETNFASTRSRIN